MRYYAMTDVGLKRQRNEDSYFIKQYDSTHMLAIVADGMGGYNGGKEASTLAVGVISQYFDSLMPELLDYSERKIKHSFLKAAALANSEIYNAANNNEELKGMGSTVVACFVSGSDVYVLNVGDSRLYIIDKDIKQITKDHSFVGELLDLGVISENQAYNHPQKNVITRALGSEAEIDADIYSAHPDFGVTVLLCTDGLTNMVDNSFIEERVKSEPNLQTACEALVEKAKEAGGNDNITVVMIRPCCGGEE